MRPELREQRPGRQAGKADQRHERGPPERRERRRRQPEPDHEHGGDGDVGERDGVGEEAAGAEAEEHDQQRGGKKEREARDPSHRFARVGIGAAEP